MICNFYQHSPSDIDKTIVTVSYEVNEEDALIYKKKMEDYMAFHFLLNNSCKSHDSNDVSLYKFGVAGEIMFTIHAHCEKCCKTHYENIHHVNFVAPYATVNFINKLYIQPEERRQNTPDLIYQWPLLVILFCFSKKNYHHIFV
jgi:hypothetical protein